MIENLLRVAYKGDMKNDSPKPFEQLEVHALEVACDGGGGALGHPKVYLHIDQEAGQITCPYCSRTYILKLLSGTRSGGH